MKDTELRQHIIDELDFDPTADAANIGVAVENGVVTLTGHVGSYAEASNAERAVKRVKGVQGIAQEIEVRLPSDKRTSDDQIARRALDLIAWDATLAPDAVQVKVQEGYVTLSGHVDWFYQKIACESSVRRLSGVTGVLNLIEVKPAIEPINVKSKIGDAFKRSAEVEAKNLQIRVNGGKVTITGSVHSWHERDAAHRAAWSVPGVTAVVNHLTVL